MYFKNPNNWIKLKMKNSPALFLGPRSHLFHFFGYCFWVSAPEFLCDWQFLSSGHVCCFLCVEDEDLAPFPSICLFTWRIMSVVLDKSVSLIHKIRTTSVLSITEAHHLRWKGIAIPQPSLVTRGNCPFSLMKADFPLGPGCPFSHLQLVKIYKHAVQMLALVITSILQFEPNLI